MVTLHFLSFSSVCRYINWYIPIVNTYKKILINGAKDNFLNLKQNKIVKAFNACCEINMNKVAIVTGANKGLGFYIVKGLCEKYKGTVYLTSRDENRGKNACDELKTYGLNPIYHQLDVSDKASIERFIQHIQDNKLEVDVLINNAGILFLKDSKETKLYQAKQTVYVNFTSLFNFTEAIIPFLGNGAKVVNISSSSAHLSRIPSVELRERFNSKDLTVEELINLTDSYLEDVKEGRDVERGWGDNAYVVSKVAVNGYTFLLHRRLAGKGIQVNCVHPGYVMSDMTRGAGNVSPESAASVPVGLALEPPGSGLYVWHDGQRVPWDGEDPRRYIDGRRD